MSTLPRPLRILTVLLLCASLIAAGCGQARPAGEIASPAPTQSDRLTAVTQVGQPGEPSPPPNAATVPAQADTQLEISLPTWTVPDNLLVYDDGLAAGWATWSWDTTLDLSSTGAVQSGSAAISVQIHNPWAALYLHVDPFIETANYDAVRFWIHGGETGGQELGFKVIDGSDGNWEPLAEVLPQAGQWTEVTVPLATLGSPASISGLVWQDQAGSAQPVFWVDQVELLARAGPPPTPIPGPDLMVDLQAGLRPISPYIYGINSADEALAAELRLPVRRWGGNATTRYNWQIDVHNTGSDWFFENIPDENPAPQNLPDGSSVDRTIEQDRRTGADSIITIPLIGWTPKRRLDQHPYDCGFKVSKYGQQQNTDAWDPDCGNGVAPNGQNITGSDPADTSLPITSAFVQEWLRHLTGKFGAADEGGVRFYSLDNEPMLWHHTHRDVHPEPLTYDELRDRTYAYAAAVKAVDPGAQTLGPVVWGWCAYFYSAADDCRAGPDYRAHGRVELVPWYLQQMSAYEAGHGQRILDYLDLHIYPQAQGVFGDAGSPELQEVRLRSTRALWDRTYIDESWIAQPIYLIPRMREWVDQNYPGTKLAITEYNWGGWGHINGALAQADILGIFGREGLDLAAFWAAPSAGDPVTYAFRIYRNYDGQSSAFGETSLRAASANPDRLAIYAARREADAAVTIIVINKTRESQAARLSITGLPSATAAQVYQYSANDLTAILRQPDMEIAAGSLTAADGLTAAFPASSITLLIVPTRTP